MVMFLSVGMQFLFLGVGRLRNCVYDMDEGSCTTVYDFDRYLDCVYGHLNSTTSDTIPHATPNRTFADTSLPLTLASCTSAKVPGPT